MTLIIIADYFYHAHFVCSFSNVTRLHSATSIRRPIIRVIWRQIPGPSFYLCIRVNQFVDPAHCQMEFQLVHRLARNPGCCSGHFVSSILCIVCQMDTWVRAQHIHAMARRRHHYRYSYSQCWSGKNDWQRISWWLAFSFLCFG